jgi:hypothetical protein
MSTKKVKKEIPPTLGHISGTSDCATDREARQQYGAAKGGGQARSPTAAEEMRQRIIQLFQEAGPDGMTVPELVERLYPELTPTERERLAADMERAATGEEVDPDWTPIYRLTKGGNH